MRPVLITSILSFLYLGRAAESFHPVLPSAPSRQFPPARIFIWGVPTDPDESTFGWTEDRGGIEGGPGPVPTQPLPHSQLRGPPQMLRGTGGLSRHTVYS